MKAGITSTAQLGREATLTREEEQELDEHVFRPEKLRFGLPPIEELLRLSCDFTEANNIKKSFNMKQK
jgi:hypothetical protein